MRKKVIRPIIIIVILFAIWLCIYIINIQQEGEDDMNYKNYVDTTIDISGTYLAPMHLFLEAEDVDHLISIVDNKIYSSTTKGASWDLEATRSSTKIVSVWHDRANDKIYGIEWNGSGNDATSFEIDYSDFGNISVTSHNGDLGDGGITEKMDIWVRDGNIEALVYEGMLIYIKRYSEGSWSTIDSFITGYAAVSRIVVVGTLAYFWADTVGNIWVFSFDGTDINSTLDKILNHSFPASDIYLGIAYDGSDNLYFTVEKDADSKNYLMCYNISGDSITEIAQLDIALQLDRNTATGVKEKGFDSTNKKVYQLHSKIPYQWYEIAAPNTTNTIRLVTDNLLVDNSGNVWEYIDMSSKVLKQDFHHPIQSYTSGTTQVDKNSITIEKGMFIQIEGKYTSAGSSNDDIIFEGKVIDFDDRQLQKVWIESPARKELEKIWPKGDYSGRSDQIMASLVADYCTYITIGTLGTGTAMGTVTFDGTITLWTVFNDLAKFENWIWYLTPQGQLYFNAGNVDSGVDLTEASKIWKLNTGEVREPYNYFYTEGAIVDGVQLYKESLNEASQQVHGFNPLSEIFAELNSQSIVDTMNANRKTRMEKVPLVVQYFHYDSTKGLIQPGETITLSYNKSEPVIASDQFLINSCNFNGRKGIGDYTVADELI